MSNLVELVSITKITSTNMDRINPNLAIRKLLISATTTKNLQSNAICERMHQTVDNVLRTLLHGEPPQNIKNAKEYIDEALSIAMHAMRVGVRSTMGNTPGNLIFNRDMFLNIPLIADWHAVTLTREHLINENLMRENQKQRRYDYIPQQKVIKKT